MNDNYKWHFIDEIKNNKSKFDRLNKIKLTIID